ncbi:sporulation initiation phosphotransferase B [Metabacillus litoralis]|uniref:sporulation initiation phosphotransferase B n=1 Tax=Metabacillus TaxID=2675233 RepID=UPI001B8FBC34|nr:sporulation initiation phosphotransferase B [Metabacillus litoralis]UHA62349.1 sporulation initiation phosphotransferase B [Metabacillus litoralis]
MKNNQNDMNIIDLLSHSRHDWMNKLQLIKGNMSLQKYDRVQDIIEEIVIEAQQESKLCNLNMPLFASYLMTFNWFSHHFTLEYEVLGDIKSISHYDEPIAKWSKEFLDILDNSVDYSGENHVSITLNTGHSNEEGIRFFFDFEGILKDKEQIMNWFERSGNHSIQVDELEISTYQITVALSLR